jgi:GMP synthase (glutamine-hydrolysing)
VLVVDNLSPFTPNIGESLEGLGVDHTCLEFSKVSTERLANSDRVILSGRRKNRKEINSANSRIVNYCYSNKKPILGICYGAEIIALTLGGTIRRMNEHVQGQTAVQIVMQNLLTNDRTEISVYESHAFCIARLPNELVPFANSKTCNIEMFSHISKPIFGTQFHPEKSGPDGEIVLRSFLKIGR